MAVTVRHLPFRANPSLRAWIKELAGWISGVHPTYTPLSWAVVEADDGNTRDVPSGGTTVDHLPGGNLWRSDSGSSPLPVLADSFYWKTELFTTHPPFSSAMRLMVSIASSVSVTTRLMLAVRMIRRSWVTCELAV